MSSSTADLTLSNTGGYPFSYTLSGTDRQGIPLQGAAIDGFVFIGERDGHGYYQSSTTMFRSAARTLCEEQGGHMVTITSAEEQSFIYQHAAYLGFAWAGLTDELSEGTWAWINGEPVSYTNWNSGEPNNGLSGGNEDYCQFNTNGSAGWNDVPDDIPAYAILEFDGYNFLGTYEGRKYYKSSTTMTWQQAKAQCEQRGGHLLTLGSEAENNYVYSLAGENCWLGFTDEVTEGVWTWVTGEPVAYTAWFPGEPNDYAGAEDYSAYYPAFGGNWADIDANRPYYSLLEIDSNNLPSVLSFSTSSGTLNPEANTGITLTFDVSGLADGIYDTSFRLVCTGITNPIYYPVTLTVSTALAHPLTLSPPSVIVNVGPESSTGTADITINNAGTLPYTYALAGINNTEVESFTLMGEYAGHKYYSSNTCMTWLAAKTLCEQRGGHLVTLGSAEEHNYVTSHAPTECWLGFSDAASEGTWNWITGEPVTYTNWYQGEPNDYNSNEDYAAFWGAVASQWIDIDNEHLYNAVLEFDSVSPVSFSAPTGTVNPGTCVTLNMTFEAVGMADGSYQRVLILNSTGSAGEVLYTFTVNVARGNLTAPAGLVFDTTQSNADAIYLDWAPNSTLENIAQYKVLRLGTEWTVITTVSASQTWYIDSNLAGLEGSIQYRIIAVNGAGNESEPCPPLTAWKLNFAPPEGISISRTSGGAVQLDWQPVTQAIGDSPATPTCYLVYASDTPNVPGNFLLAGIVTDTLWTTNPDATVRFYLIKSYSGNPANLSALSIYSDDQTSHEQSRGSAAK